jgi:hypothetical protein
LASLSGGARTITGTNTQTDPTYIFADMEQTLYSWNLETRIFRKPKKPQDVDEGRGSERSLWARVLSYIHIG